MSDTEYTGCMTTHHIGCACREEGHRQEIAALKSENAKLRAALELIISEAAKGDGTSTECELSNIAMDTLEELKGTE